MRENPHAVTAHLRNRTVGVAVIHVPVAGVYAVGYPVEDSGC